MIVKPRLRAALPGSLAAFGGLVSIAVPVLLGIDAAPDGAGAGGRLFLLNNLEYLFLFTPALAPIIKVLTTTYIIEEDGIREQARFLSTTDRRITWEKVTALRQRRSVFDALLGIQRLDVIAYGERGATIHLVGLSNAPELRNRFARNMRDSASVDSLFRAD